MSNVGKWIERLFNEHMLVRRFMVFWAISLITYVILKVFVNPETISTPAAVALGSVVGLLTTVLAFYVRSRQLDERAKWQEAHHGDQMDHTLEAHQEIPWDVHETHFSRSSGYGNRDRWDQDEAGMGGLSERDRW